MEKIIIAANSYVGGKRATKLSCVRYGNVVGSRGSVIPVFNQQKETGTITITDKRMTRFWIALEQGVQLVIKTLETMLGGEVFIPKIPSMKIMDLAKVIAPECEIIHTGVRPGEKLHECLLTEDEARHSLEFKDHFVIEPEFHWWTDKSLKGGEKLPDGFRYTSDKNIQWLTVEQLNEIIKNQ